MLPLRLPVPVIARPDDAPPVMLPPTNVAAPFSVSVFAPKANVPLCIVNEPLICVLPQSVTVLEPFIQTDPGIGEGSSTFVVSVPAMV